jgi:hypothetical protein
MSWFGGNKRLDELKAAFDNAHFSRKESMLYDQCKEIIEDPGFKSTSGPEKGLCFFNFHYGQCSFSIGSTTRAVSSQPCIVITGKMQIGHNKVDIKINCTQKFPTDPPQVYFSQTGAGAFHAFPFATLPPPGDSQHWNFCAGTTLVKLLHAMQLYSGPLPYSSPAAIHVPMIASHAPLVPPPALGFVHQPPPVLQTKIGATFAEQSPMDQWMKNPNAPHQFQTNKASPSPGYPPYPINPVAINSHQQYTVPPPPYPSGSFPNPHPYLQPSVHGQFAQLPPHTHSDSDTVPTPPIIHKQFPVLPPSMPPPPEFTNSIPHSGDRPIYQMGFNFDAVQSALREASQDEARAIEILLQQQQQPGRFFHASVEPPPDFVTRVGSIPVPPPGPYPSIIAHPPPLVSTPPPPPPLYDDHRPPQLPPPRAAAHCPPQPFPARAADKEFTIVFTLDGYDVNMCVKASSYLELLEGIKSNIGPITSPEVCGADGKWVPMSEISFGDLPACMQVRVSPAASAHPPAEYTRRVVDPPVVPPQEKHPSYPPPALHNDDISAFGSYPIVKSSEIQFDLDSQGKRIELGHGVFKAVYRGRLFGTPVAVCHRTARRL